MKKNLWNLSNLKLFFLFSTFGCPSLLTTTEIRHNRRLFFCVCGKWLKLPCTTADSIKGSLYLYALLRRMFLTLQFQYPNREKEITEPQSRTYTQQSNEQRI